MSIPVPSHEIADDWLHLALEAGNLVGWDWDVQSGMNICFGDLPSVLGIPYQTHVAHIDEFRSRLHPEDHERVWSALQEARNTRKQYVAEFRVVHPDGTVRWIAAQGRFHYSPEGEAERMLGLAVDVTGGKKTEEALRQKKMELTEAQQLARMGSWQWDAENDIVTWSEELYRIAGRDPKLPAVNYQEHPKLYTAESWERLRVAVERALSTGEPYEMEVEMIRTDGTTRWVMARGAALRDAAGRVNKLFGSVQDITERRRSREALRESEERWRLAAQAGRMYSYHWDMASDVITRSAESAHILGLISEPSRLTCRDMLMSVHPDDRQKVVAATLGCTPENPTCRVRYRVLRPDGTVVWLQKNARAFFDAKGTMVRSVGMVADITEGKLVEEALAGVSRRLIEAQETERARIARDLHDDIGQRLALLSVTLEKLKQVPLESKEEVRGGMDELRRQILEISSSIHSLSHELHSSTLRYLDVVNAMRGFCAELSEQQKVEINFSHIDIPGVVSQEISLCLFRVLQEALHNAVKHSQVRLFDVELRGTSGAVHLVIRDSGLGFDPQAAFRGRGLGLTSMQERLKLVDGELSIESQPGCGTTVRASVPLSSAKTAGAGR